MDDGENKEDGGMITITRTMDEEEIKAAHKEITKKVSDGHKTYNSDSTLSSYHTYKNSMSKRKIIKGKKISAWNRQRPRRIQPWCSISSSNSTSFHLR